MSKPELVFAYGSNMVIDQMEERCPDSRGRLNPFAAKAEGWKLCFPRSSEKRKGGVGSIVRVAGEIVWGVVFHVATTQDMEKLDRREGILVNSYHREKLTVAGEDGKQHETWTYFAVPQDNPPKHYVPHRDYLAFYIQGAEYFKLDKTYIEELKKIKTVK